MHGVALIPLLVMTGLIILALFLTLSPVAQRFDSYEFNSGYFEVRTADTANAVLTGLLTGLISITVFGFSMMIVVVNQAASNYSPKVVQTLSSEKSNQYILGFDLGTIIFTLIVMMHIDNQKVDGGVPQVAILINMILAIIALILFIQFINNISNAVRINNIVNMLSKKTRKSIEHSRKEGTPSNNIKTDGWNTYDAGHAGHFQMIRHTPLLETLEKLDAVLQVLPRPGTYYLQNEPLFCINKKLDEETAQKIRNNFITYHGERIEENPMYGFRQLREVAVKSLSPGINDPGVAILCIEHLTELLSMDLDRQEQYAICDGNGDVRIIINTFDFPSLFEISFVPIKTYGKRDYSVLSALLHAVRQISLHDRARKMKHLLNRFAMAVIEDARDSITSQMEIDSLNERIAHLNKDGYFDLEPMNSSKERIEK